MPNTKHCRRCDTDYPLKEMVVDRGKPTTLCRLCSRTRAREYYVNNRAKILARLATYPPMRDRGATPDTRTSKICSLCKKRKRMAQFYPYYGRFSSRCKRCTAIEAAACTARSRAKRRQSP